jgi:hypothetical protein
MSRGSHRGDPLAMTTSRHAEIFKTFGANPDRFKVTHEVLRPEP